MLLNVSQTDFVGFAVQRPIELLRHWSSQGPAFNIRV
jgi:hypothetical protein